MTRQARLISQWMLVGFIHGVMNTDNMLVSGETIDYGPCAFMDHYDPATVFSSIDRGGRYAYGNQPAIALWNLARSGGGPGGRLAGGLAFALEGAPAGGLGGADAAIRSSAHPAPRGGEPYQTFCGT